MYRIFFGCLVLFLFTLPSWTGSAHEQEKVKPIDVRITRTKDADVTIDVQGSKCYAWDFDIFPADRKGYFHVVVTFIELDHSTHTGGRIGEARSIVLKNVLCDVKERDKKSLVRAPNYTYTLVEGPDADPGKGGYLEGTFTWKIADGNVHFFHEKGTKRVWKCVPPPKKEKK